MASPTQFALLRQYAAAMSQVQARLREPAAEHVRRPAAEAVQPRDVTCVSCGRPFTVRGPRERKTCGRAECQRKYRNARTRKRDHLRRSSVSDITPEQELAMRLRARTCLLCGVKLTSKIGLPNSKHLDHILPISQGGTHTHGNTRIICQACNLGRPKNGSDFTGQLTLFAQTPGLARLSGHWNESRGTCRKGLHPWIPANIERHGSKQRCKPCRLAWEQEHDRIVELKQCKCGAMYPAPGRTFMCPDCMDAVARKAAELHANGLTWNQVAAQVGYESGTGAMDAAKRIGYIPAPKPPKPPKAVPQRLCPDCGTPKRSGKGPSGCEPCTTAKAWRAVEMRMQEGRTLRYIADALGFSSITAVTNLMKTVVEVESRMGRPRL